MLKKKYMKDDIVFLGSEKDVEMKLDNEKPPTSLLYEDCFKPLMRVARIDWKPLLWNAALALQSSKSASYFLNKPENEEDLTASTLQGGLVYLWKLSCMTHKTKTEYILQALQRKAPSYDHALQDLKSFFNVRKYPLDYMGPWFHDERWQLFLVEGKNIEEPFRYHGSWAYAVHSILTKGFASSQSEVLGHEFHKKAPGTYTSRTLENSGGYARATNLFGNGALYQFVFLVNARGKPSREYKNEGGQEVWKPDQLDIPALLVRINDFTLEFGTRYIPNFCPYFECHPNRLSEIVFEDRTTFTIRHVRPASENEVEEYNQVLQKINTSVKKVQRLLDEVPLTCLFCEAYIDMKQSLYHKDMKWKANFMNLLTLPYVLLPELSTVHLRSESFNWKHIATVMAQTHTYINRVDGVDKTLDNLGAVLQGLLSKALNEKYRHNLLRDCLDFCFFAKILNSFAEKKKSPLRCIAKFDDNTVDWDELVIKKIDVLTHWGDLRFKYTKPRDRIWNNHRTGRKIEYTQAALTREQQRTATSRAARQHAGTFAKASRRVYDETAARQNQSGG